VKAPRVAWPTLALLVGALVVWSVGLATGSIASSALGAYVAFTPLHEAAHRSLCRARWVNEVVGRVAAIPLLGPFPAVRYLHLEHHKHTNDPDRDPDHWSGRGPAWLLPLRWLTQDLHYYAVYLRRSRPWRERIECVVTIAVLLAIASPVWLIGSRIAVGVLAVLFDYLPHRPHVVTAKQDRYRATACRRGAALYVLTLGQSMHLVHHLYPGVPFYRYASVPTTTHEG
jgi:fatty acid desaturase